MPVIIVIISLLLNGCTLAAQYFGASATTLQLAQTADMAKITLDAVSTLETGKPIVDHVTSKVLDKDCNSFRLFRGQSICQEVRPIQSQTLDLGP